ncbi:hypothetical protein CDAR_417151 [Caerostris darwini]|uniref:Uncharacterized protein n=1 Tax=Caerostris darwini TaxID=1538125 RepID=A0AAV4X8X9_9ARAC|nr:hypothetical protein CDAR_417151 [Caerostris darwini]
MARWPQYSRDPEMIETKMICGEENRLLCALPPIEVLGMMIEYRISSATTFGRPLSSASKARISLAHRLRAEVRVGGPSPKHAYPISGEAGSDVTKGVKSGGQLDGPCTGRPIEGEEIETGIFIVWHEVIYRLLVFSFITSLVGSTSHSH